MKRDDSILDFNFWPAFVDLMLSLVLIMTALFVIVISDETSKVEEELKITEELLEISAKEREAINVRLDIVKRNQDIMGGAIKKVAKRYNFEVGIRGNLGKDFDRQRLTFSAHVLFDVGEWQLKEEGKVALKVVGEVLRNNISLIREIQILGHADIQKSTRGNLEYGNLQLAGLRAMEVFTFLQKSAGIDPAVYRMSATSFAEFHPTDREDGGYSLDKLKEANASEEQMSANRRIELLLIYKND